MKAKEYLNIFFDESLLKIMDNGWKAGIINFAEAYHKAKVEGINDEDINFENEMRNHYANGMEGTYEEGKFVGFDNGAEWFKQKLNE